MPGEWTPIRFGQMARLVRDTVNPAEAVGLPYIGLEHIGEGSLSLVGLGVAENATSFKYRFQRGDILFGKLRPYFRKVIRATFEGICSTDIWVCQPRIGVDAGFLFYLMASDLFIEPVVRASEGTKMPRAQWEFACDLELSLPTLLEQRAIAHILGTLNDKIELNRRMSETLEAMARALFKSWFVDFDPVRAKADGRWRRGQSLPGLPAHLYDLFPSRLVDSELGEIPEGWGVKAIGDVIERLPVGKKYEQKTVNTFGRVPVLDQGKSGVIGYHENEPGVFASMETPVVVFANHTCNMRLIHFPFSAIQNVLPFIGMEIDTIWSFYATYGKQSFIEYKGHWPDFIIHKIVRPEPELTREFARLMRPLLRQTWTSEHETRTLTFLRDLLLPKLIYGELRVKDAERFV